jgi:hypothetical protein
MAVLVKEDGPAAGSALVERENVRSWHVSLLFNRL